MDQNWPAQSSKLWPTDKSTPYARNSRAHSDEQVAQIAASIREWGWTNPVLIDEDGGLIAGHGRLLAAPRRKLTMLAIWYIIQERHANPFCRIGFLWGPHAAEAVDLAQAVASPWPTAPCD